MRSGGGVSDLSFVKESEKEKEKVEVKK